MPIFHELPAAPGGVPVKAWTANLEANAAAQLRALAGSGLLIGHVAAMPDVHAGRGATVGAVFATRDLLLPSAIGTDIGCGVLAQPLDVHAGDLPTALLRELQAQIKWTIPLAHGEQGEAQAWDGLADAGRYTSAVARIVREAGPWQLGTLGGGNHFLELCRETEGEEGAGRVWLLVHSGSRGVGSAIAAHHIGIARTLAPRLGRPIVGDLAPLPLDTQEGQDYLTDLLWAQAYAAENRRQLQRAILDLLARLVGRHLRHELVYDLTAGFDSVHNYAAREQWFGEPLWVHRKGAAAAPSGSPGIVPGSMATGSALVRGLGNAAALGSCSHGAGRRMSRGQAARTITPEAFAHQMRGVVADTGRDLLDEAPQAYKALDTVLAEQADLITPVGRLLPLLNVKGVPRRTRGADKGGRTPQPKDRTRDKNDPVQRRKLEQRRERGRPGLGRGR